MTPIGFIRNRCQLPPIRDDFRGAQASKEPSGRHPGIRKQKTRKEAQDRGSMKTKEGITWRDQMTKLVAAYGTAGTRSCQRDTATVVVCRAQDRRTRRRKKQQSVHALGRAWPCQVRSHSGQLYLVYRIRREV
ncbi:hypothetical protein NDU88_006846 [Pleurodeles waltl]|uniref:Uncharacterized protein n=1 Tax=Pleurodeles waltl TaxID=8319 RepID=A0AAV7SQT8_PLEWA|nr:hypothetical protein NDU88_006846 [Pleurodeles waltl]